MSAALTCHAAAGAAVATWLASTRPGTGYRALDAAVWLVLAALWPVVLLLDCCPGRAG